MLFGLLLLDIYSTNNDGGHWVRRISRPGEANSRRVDRSYSSRFGASRRALQSGARDREVTVVSCCWYDVLHLLALQQGQWPYHVNPSSSPFSRCWVLPERFRAAGASTGKLPRFSQIDLYLLRTNKCIICRRQVWYYHCMCATLLTRIHTHTHTHTGLVDPNRFLFSVPSPSMMAYSSGSSRRPLPSHLPTQHDRPLRCGNWRYFACDWTSAQTAERNESTKTLAHPFKNLKD